MELMQKVGSVAALVFVVFAMLTMGLGLSVGEIVAPLRSVRLLVLALVSNYVLMPLVALGLGRMLGLDQPLLFGLLLMGAAGGAPFLPKLVQVAKGNPALAVGLMVFQMVVALVFMPLALPIIMPGVSINPMKIAASLLVTMALPLAAALTIKAVLPRAAARAKPLFDKLSSLALVVCISLLIAANIHSLLGVFGEFAILASLLFVAIGYGIGWVLGGSDTDTRRALALATAARNIGAALVVAGQSFSDPRVVVMVIVFTVVTVST
ncbi:MAG: bile acid:sodium symporter family protein, partial [Blastocatellia bacterium]